mmetsp:Transcript_5585/g.24812  ORF Transcript_5585/g.24812 Transcript_5585/m.24812 type:complete len:244 (+) Transcript_5585:1378-2109(+)
MQKSLKRSQSDLDTWSMPSSAARASATGVDGSFAASAAAIRPGVNPLKPEFSPYMASPAASAAARPASTAPLSFSDVLSSDVLSSDVLSSAVESLAIAAIGIGDTPGVMPLRCLGAEKSPGTSTYGGLTLTNASGCPTSFRAPVSSTPPPGESSSSSSAGRLARHTKPTSSYVTSRPSFGPFFSDPDSSAARSSSPIACVTETSAAVPPFRLSFPPPPFDDAPTSPVARPPSPSSSPSTRTRT